MITRKSDKPFIIIIIINDNTAPIVEAAMHEELPVVGWARVGGQAVW